MAAPVPRMYAKVWERENCTHMHLLKTVFFLQPYLCALLNTLLALNSVKGFNSWNSSSKERKKVTEKAKREEKKRREGSRQGTEMRTSLSDKHQQDLDLRKFDGKWPYSNQYLNLSLFINNWNSSSQLILATTTITLTWPPCDKTKRQSR